MDRLKLLHVSTVAVVFFFAPVQADAEQWSMGYFTPWGRPPLPVSDVQWDGLTHVAMYGAVPQGSGALTLTFPNMASIAPELICAAHSNNDKVLLSIWQNGDGDFLQAAKKNRGTLVRNIMSIVNQYGFDGVDIDWEGPTYDKDVAEDLVKDLRSSLGPTKQLTITLSTIPKGNEAAMSQYVNRLNVMTYDLCGNWDPISWHNSALYSSPHTWSLDLARKKYEAVGVPSAKISLGLAFYGYRAEGVTAPRIEGAQFSRRDLIPYSNIVANYDTTQAHWDDEAKVPWLSLDNGYLTYDNKRSIKEKVKYMQDKELGGWIIWALDSDYSPEQESMHPLLDAVSEAMGGSVGDAAPRSE